jgi:hypothetical protein
LRGKLDHVDADAAAAERDRKREPGDPAADDQNLSDVIHRATPAITAASDAPP